MKQLLDIAWLIYADEIAPAYKHQNDFDADFRFGKTKASGVTTMFSACAGADGMLSTTVLNLGFDA